MHRSNGIASVGRNWLQNGVRPNGQASRNLSSGGQPSQSGKVIIVGLAAVGVGVAYNTGYIKSPWRSNDSQQLSKLSGSLHSISAKIPTVSAISYSAADTHRWSCLRSFASGGN